MSQVPSEPLSQVAEVIMGSSPKGSSYNAEGIGAPLLNGPTDFGPRHPTATLFTTSGARFSDVGDILFCVRGSTTGRMNWSDRRYAIGRGIAAIRGRTRHETTYLRACIELVLPTLLSGAAGSTFPNLGRDQMASIPVPMIPERESTGAFLAAIDDLIDNKRRRIELLEQMAHAIYREWFVHFRFPGHEDAAAVDSPLGPIPDEWEVCPLNEVATIVRGRSYRKHELVEVGGKPFVNLKCMMRGGGFRRDGLKRYEGKHSPDQHVRQGDIVLAVTDLTQGREILARATLVPRLGEEVGVISLDVMRIVPNNPEDRLATYFALSATDFAERVKEFANGSTVLHLSPTHVANGAVVWPAERLRRRFAQVAEPMLSQVEELNDGAERLAGIRDLLLPKLVTGEIDVSGLDLNALTESVA